MVASAPVSCLKGFWEYRWMGSYLGTFAFIDRLFEGFRGHELKIAHLNMHAIVQSLTKKIALVLANDRRFGGGPLTDRMVPMDEVLPPLFMAGFKEVLMMDSMPNVSKEKAYLENFMEKVGQGNAEERAAGNRNYVAGVSYLKKEMTADPTIKKTASGLAYKVIREGKGAKLQESQVARVHYVGKHIDGTVFDSSRQRGQVAEFAPSDVISGFKEGLLMMNPGSVYRFYIPGSLGYGEKGVPGGQIGPNEMLVFEVELLGIK